MSKPAFHREIKAFSLTLVLSLGVAPAAGQSLEPLKDPMRLDPRRVSAPESEPAESQETDLPALGSLGETARATIHLASYYREEDAMRGWDILSQRHPDVLADLDPILRDIDLGSEGFFVRLLAGPLRDQNDALDLCSRLSRQGAYCVPANIAGEFLPLSEGAF